MATWRMRIASWITKATNVHSEYVILLAFPLQQRLHERTSMLRWLSGFLFHLLCSTNELTTPGTDAETDNARTLVNRILFCDFAFVSKIFKTCTQ